MCAFQSLRKMTTKEYPKKTILNELFAKKRPISVQNGSSQLSLATHEFKTKIGLALGLSKKAQVLAKAYH